MKIKVGNKDITIRKWKGKDKKKFISLLKDESLNEVSIMEAMVYSCIEENVILSVDEFKYVLSRIRAYSLGEEISIEFYCDKCGDVFNKEFKLSDVFTYTYKELKEIDIPGAQIKLGPIKNKEIYIKKIAEDSYYDLLLRVERINGNDAFTLEELENIIDEMDLDVLEQIMEIYYDSKFTIHDINEVQCPSCGDKSLYEFDELPGFFPETWFE